MEQASKVLKHREFFHETDLELLRGVEDECFGLFQLSVFLGVVRVQLGEYVTENAVHGRLAGG